MVKKLRCCVTGNIIYMTPKRYAKALLKYQNEENLKANYKSLLGRKILDGMEEMPTDGLKNRIKCNITNKWHFISNQRINNVLKKYGDWESYAKRFICRDAMRLLKQGKTPEEIKQILNNN